jgi:undecaprenyl-diphosphatase
VPGGRGYDDRVLDALVDFVWRLGQWGYVIVFVAATLETSVFVGLVVPGDTIALLAGFLVSAGVLGLPETIVVAALGAALGDSIGYELGRRLGRPWLVRHGGRVGLGPARLARLDALFARHGGKAVFIGRFIAVARALTPFMAGSSRMPYLRFLGWNLAGAILWAVALVVLGYALGESWRIAERWVGRAALIASVLVVLAVVVGWRLRRRRAAGA